jgi:hypothetical protein
VANPGNSCQVCNPSQSATEWSPGAPCNLCHDAAGTEGICSELGICCTIICEGTCKVDGGQGTQQCGSNSDCCGIPENICT